MSKENTIRQYIDSIVDKKIHKQLMKNTATVILDETAPDLVTAIRRAFVWRHSTEGLEYWIQIKNNARDNKLKINPIK